MHDAQDRLAANSVERKLLAGRPAFGGALDGLRERIVASVVGDTPQSVGRYRLGRALGSGAFGTVYEAEDPRLQRRVAIKIVAARSSREAARVLHEARTLATLSHPNVVHVFEVGVTTRAPSAPYVVMELVEGQSLRSWLEGARRPWRAVVDVILQAARGLAAAHRAGVVHRDFKPDNVLIGNDARARVIDFGLARWIDDLYDVATEESGTLVATHLTPTGAVMGTPAYMAPEVFASQCTPQADQYSLCVTLYEALYGKRPFEALSTEELRAQLMEREAKLPDDHRGVPGRINAVVLRGLRRDPDERWPDLTRLISALESARRWRVGLPALAVGGGVLAVGLALAGDPRDEPCARGNAAWQDIRAARSVSDRIEFSRAEYERDWLDAEQLMCAANNGRLPDAQRSCLDERLRDVTALLEVLRELDVGDKRLDDDPVRRLPSPADCAGAVLELSPHTPPEMLARTAQLEAELSRLRALDSTAQVAAGLELSARLLDEARALENSPMTAEIMFMRGRMLLVSSDYVGANTAFEEAYFVAQREGFDRVAARSASELVRLAGFYRGDVEAAHRWAAHTEAAFVRAGMDPRRHAPYLEALAGLASREGDLVSAVELLEEAIAVTVAIEGEGAQLQGGLLNHLGTVHWRLERYDECVATSQRAASIHEATDGAVSPTRASALDNAGLCLFELHRDEEALASHREAFDIRQATLEPDHAHMGASYGNLARTLDRLGRHDEALEFIDRAHDLFLRRDGPDDPNVAIALQIRGTIHTHLGPEHVRLAIADFERAAQVLEDAGPMFAEQALEMRARAAELTE